MADIIERVYSWVALLSILTLAVSIVVLLPLSFFKAKT